MNWWGPVGGPLLWGGVLLWAACEQPRPAPAAQAPRAPVAPLRTGPPGAAGPPLPESIPAPRDVRKPPALAERYPSGLAMRLLRTGTGPRPGPRDKVRVHYTGWTRDGRMFDSTRTAGKRPAVFRVDTAIAGWVEALSRMRSGAQARLWVPKALAFEGREGQPQQDVVFDVEVLRVKAAGPVVHGHAELPVDTVPFGVALKKAKRERDAVHCLQSQSAVTRAGRPVSREQAIELCYRQYAVARRDMHTCSALGDEDVRLQCTNEVMRARGVDEKLSRL